MLRSATLLKDKYYILGLSFILLSLLIFSVAFIDAGADGLLFVFNYLLAIIYLVALWQGGYLKRGNNGMPHIMLFLVLSVLSAYSFNRIMPVFEVSVPWYSTLLFIYCSFFISFGFWHYFPKWLKYVFSLVLGSSLVGFLYLTLYCAQLMPVSLIIFFVLGLSLHSFVPVFVLLAVIKLVRRVTKENKRYLTFVLIGCGISILVPALFAYEWGNINGIVRHNYQRSLIADNDELPGWIKVAAKLPETDVTEKYLKSGLVYTTANNSLDFGFNMPNSFTERRKHDPLVMFASCFNRASEIEPGERIKILEVMFDSRHKAQERLWSGINLSTKHLISNIKIWPAQRLAYTEQTITIENSHLEENWRTSEEAIYTFHLPEGGVAVALSLWIDGKEQKSVLTSLQKADTAYKQIVGVERHDPSVLHWQEGNTVTVRVFPVTTDANRIFKIGVVAPLVKKKDILEYGAIKFDGPEMKDGQEIVQVEWAEEPKGYSMPTGFTRNGAHRFISETSFDPDRKLQFHDPGFHEASFSFNGATYSMQKLLTNELPLRLKNIYLDINKQWTNAEIEQVSELVEKYNIYMYLDEMIKVTPENKKALIRQLQKQNFSLFPFYEISNDSATLVISKSFLRSPNLKDLKTTGFLSKLGDKLKRSNKINLFNLGDELSPYLKSLREHRAFNYAHGDVSDLKILLEQSKFPSVSEDDNHVALFDAQLLLTKSNGMQPSTGPDHLMRLFAYNHIMHQLKSRLAPASGDDSLLVAEAEQAYVVSPVSSMIVLETQNDYDRFGIKKGSNSLDNASMNGSGAVPEPGEWALIIIAIGVASYMLNRNKFKRAV